MYLPTSTNKLLATWHGLYNVIKRVGKVNYEVKIQDRHKKGKGSACECAEKVHNLAELARSLWIGRKERQRVRDIRWDHLDLEQKQELQALHEGYADVLQSVPGQTNLTTHKIERQIWPSQQDFLPGQCHRHTKNCEEGDPGYAPTRNY